MSRAAYMREYRARRRAFGPHPPTVSFVDYPVVDGVATLPDGRTIRSDSQVVRVAVPHNLPKPPPYIEPEKRIRDLEEEVARLKRELAQRPQAPPVSGPKTGHPLRQYAEFRPAPKPGRK